MEKEMIMKMSKFNNFIETLKSFYVFNSFSGSLIELDKKYFEFLQSGNILKLSESEINILKNQGIVVTDKCNEKSLIRYFFYKARYGNQILSMTIVPTLECNFSCPYCYEKKLKGSMSTDIWNAIIKFLRQNWMKFETINIIFYGGEPLLEINSIFRFLEEYSIIDTSILKRTNFSMITNGYLLSKDVINKLNNFGVDDYQITIDGDEKIHNQRRPHKIKNDSYQVITKNIHYALTKSRISIRTNMDLNNSIFDLEYFLKRINYPKGHKNLHIYSGNLNNDDSNPDFDIHSDSSFSKCYLDNHKKALSKKAASFSSNSFHLAPRESFCSADSINTYCFLPNSKIVNCWNHLASMQEIAEFTIGEIKNGNVEIDRVKLANWFDLTDISNIPKKCDDCNLLPICLSGCPKARSVGTVDCCYPKFWLKDYISSIAFFKSMKEDT